MLQMTGLLDVLARNRPIFHSEADFQHALAWELHQMWRGCSIRLEAKPPDLESGIRLDIWAASKDAHVAIELKYKTRRLCVTVDAEAFCLAKQQAENLARYGFLKDIQRLEQVISETKATVGYAILLTNDRLYWCRPKQQTMDVDFRLQEGRKVSGTLSWRPDTAKGTKKGKEEPVVIGATYSLHWQDYSAPSQEPNGKFRYLLVQVGG